ncbi:CDP-glycerol glycerophosphotransferase family protein, partial [Actinocorallia lasiicapitis]
AGLTLRVRRRPVPGTPPKDVLVERDYPRMRKRPLRDAVVFDTHEGRRYACNPRAIFEELRGRDLALDYLWVCADGQFPAPPGARTVVAGSAAHFEALATARLIVGNQRMPRWFAKRDDQIYLQTWHGTPLKTIGRDVTTLLEARADARARAEREVPSWDLVLSPNPHTTPIMRSAYGYEGEILESGYPRNDLLYAPGRAERAAEVRARLGLPAGKKVLLYAPTWRDDASQGERKEPVRPALDLAEMRTALGDTHVLLIRGHHYTPLDRDWRRSDAFVRDVTAYPDIAELYLVADQLITDYSSSMFDFAGTGRPLVFYTYDYERYRDEVHGFYFDLAAEAPGPLVRTTGEVIAAVRAEGAGFADARARFAAKYCPYDDGHAARRVVDQLLKMLSLETGA